MELRKLFKVDCPSLIPFFEFFSVLFYPERHFEPENKLEGVIIYLIQHLVLVGAVYVMINTYL